MQCPKCGSNNVNVQMVNTKIKTNHTGILHSLGRATLILCTCGLWLLVPSRKQNARVKNVSMAICQQCGHNWKA